MSEQTVTQVALLCGCLFSCPRVSLAVLLVLLFITVCVTLLVCLIPMSAAAGNECVPRHSKYAVYRHAAVASDAAPCSVVGRYGMWIITVVVVVVVVIVVVGCRVCDR